MRPILRCAYLRVYQPPEALPERERERAERMSRDPLPVRGARGAAIRPHPLGLVAPEERRAYYERVVDGRRYICPARLRLRTLLGLLSFERSVPDGAIVLFFPPEELAAAKEELEELRSEVPALRPSMIESPWYVPVRWFACFEDTERLVEQGEDRLRIRYETTVGDARQRLGGALEVLEASRMDESVTAMVRDLSDWVGAFDGGSILELDYASVSELFTDEELADDHSARDVARAVDALGRGDGFRAGLHYQKVSARWMRAGAYASLN